MPLTVGDALKLEVLQPCRVLTGSAGLQNEIRWVNILEILDDLSHIEAGEFLITTAYDLNMENEARQRELIAYFKNKGLAALAIQTGHYVKEIPPHFVELAAAHGIPVIEIPPETSFKKLTRGLLGELMRRNGLWENGGADEESTRLRAMLRRSHELLGRLTRGENPANLKEELSQMQIVPEDAFLAIAIKALPLEPAEAGAAKQDDPLLMELTLVHIAAQHKLPFLAGPLGESYVLLLQAGKQPPEQLLPVARRVLSELKLFFPQFKFVAGASSVRHKLAETGSALEEARKAAHIAELNLITGEAPLAYDDLGPYKILTEVQSSEPLISLYRETVAPLLDYDRRTGGELMETLRKYLNTLNISRASRELYIHRHTMKYRLNQIEEITKLPLHVPGNIFKLHLGLLIYDYLHARGSV